MRDLNKVLLLGRLGFDPELRRIPSGTAVTELSVATSYEFELNGESKKETCWTTVVLWGKFAENACEYLRKGSQVFVEGRLRLEQWEDQNGEKRSKLKVVAELVRFLDARRDRDDSDDGGYANAPRGENGGRRQARDSGGARPGRGSGGSAATATASRSSLPPTERDIDDPNDIPF
jgi:single-strand DNA-binding protein